MANNGTHTGTNPNPSLFGQIDEKLAGQQWYQELKEKWDSIDTERKILIQQLSFFGTLGVSFLFVLWMGISVALKRSELREKQDFYLTLQTAGEDLKRAKSLVTSAPSAGLVQWPEHFQSLVQTAGMDKANLEIAPEIAGAASPAAKEILFNISLKKITVRQLVKFSHALDYGTGPITKTRKITVSTEGPEGYLNAQIQVSAFQIKEDKAKEEKPKDDKAKDEKIKEDKK